MLLTAAGPVLGAHLATAHSRGGQEAFNPGVYARLDSGATLGAYRNSYGRASVYAAWTFETADRRFALTVGGVSGYRAAAVQPLLVPSARLPLRDGYALRLGLLPKPPHYGGSAGLHLMFERALP